MNKNTLGLVVLTAFAAAGARAADPVTETPPPPKAEEPKETPPKEAAPKPAGQQKQIDKLAAEFGVTKEEVSGLRDKGLGWGEVKRALSISRSSGKPVADVLKLRESGLGWGAIAKKEGVKLSPDRIGKGAEPSGERGAGSGRETGGGRERGHSDRGHGKK